MLIGLACKSFDKQWPSFANSIISQEKIICKHFHIINDFKIASLVIKVSFILIHIIEFKFTNGIIYLNEHPIL